MFSITAWNNEKSSVWTLSSLRSGLKKSLCGKGLSTPRFPQERRGAALGRTLCTQPLPLCACWVLMPRALGPPCGVLSFTSVSSVQSLSRVRLFATHGLQHARPPCPSATPGVSSNSCPLSRWCHPTVSSSVVPFSSHLQSFPASGSFPMSQFFTSGGQNTGVSASASVLPINIQDWFSLWLTGWISLQFKGLSRVFSNTTVQKHQFFGAQLSL